MRLAVLSLVLLAGCAAAPVAKVLVTPVLPTVETSPQWGRCLGGGVHVAGAIEVTDHLCYRWLDADAAVPPLDGAVE